MNAILWVVQVILSVLFLFAGGTKLICLQSKWKKCRHRTPSIYRVRY